MTRNHTYTHTYFVAVQCAHACGGRVISPVYPFIHPFIHPHSTAQSNQKKRYAMKLTSVSLSLLLLYPLSLVMALPAQECPAEFGKSGYINDLGLLAGTPMIYPPTSSHRRPPIDPHNTSTHPPTQPIHPPLQMVSPWVASTSRTTPRACAAPTRSSRLVKPSTKPACAFINPKRTTTLWWSPFAPPNRIPR